MTPKARGSEKKRETNADSASLGSTLTYKTYFEKPTPQSLKKCESKNIAKFISLSILTYYTIGIWQPRVDLEKTDAENSAMWSKCNSKESNVDLCLVGSALSVFNQKEYCRKTVR